MMEDDSAPKEESLEEAVGGVLLCLFVIGIMWGLPYLLFVCSGGHCHK